MYLVGFAMEMREKTNTVKAKKTTRKESVWVRDGPLENLWGGGGRAKYKKKIRAREN